MIRFHVVDDQKVQSVRRYGKLVKLPVDDIKRPVPILDRVDERSGFAALHNIRVEHHTVGDRPNAFK